MVSFYSSNHDYSQVAGEVLSYTLGEDKNYAVAKLFKTPLGDELLEEIARGRSGFPWATKLMQLTKEADGEQDAVYTVTRYCVDEISSVPCDKAADRSARVSIDAVIASVRAEELTKEEILAAIRRDWETEQEKERLRLLDEQCSKLHYYHSQW